MLFQLKGITGWYGRLTHTEYPTRIYNQRITMLTEEHHGNFMVHSIKPNLSSLICQQDCTLPIYPKRNQRGAPLQ